MKMKIKNDFLRKLDKVAGDTTGQPETLEACLEEFMKKAPEAQVGIKRYRRGTHLTVGMVAVRDMHASISNIDEFILDEFGGGRFLVEFYDSIKRTLAHYNRNIEGPIKQYGTKAEDNGDSAKSPSKSFQHELIAMLQTQNTAMLGMLTSGGDSSKFEEFAMQFMSNQMDNRLTREEHALESASGILSLVQQARPEIPPEDSNVALIQAVGSALGGFMNYKAAQANSPLSALMGGQGAPDTKALPPGLESLAGVTPEQMQTVLQSLTPEQLKQLGRKPLTPITTPRTVELAGPGEQQPVEAGSSTVQPPSIPRVPLEHVTFEVKIQELRADAKKGVEPEILANEIIALVESSRMLTPNNPHPLLKKLTIEDDPAKLQVAMMDFFQKIPEFADPELQKQVGIAIYEIITGEEIAEDQAQPEEAGENDELLSPTPGVQQSGTDDTGDTAENDATEQSEHGRIDTHEPGGNDSEGIDKPGSASDGENIQAKVA